MATTRIEKTPRRGAGERAPTFLDHFPQLLLAAYHHRYITPEQLQRLFPNTYATKSNTTAKRHLRTLEQLGYLKPRQLAKHTPKIYSPKPTKIHHLLRQYYPDTTFHQTREETTKDNNLDHELAITDIQIDIQRAAEQHPNLAILDQHRRYFHQPNHLTYQDGQGTARHLEPDLSILFHINKPDGPFPLLYFIEMDMGTETPTTVHQKLHTYSQWHTQHGAADLIDLYRQHGNADPKPAYRLLLVTRNQNSVTLDHSRAHLLYHEARTITDKYRHRIRLTTNQAITKARATNGILTNLIWYPPLAELTRPASLFHPAT